MRHLPILLLLAAVLAATLLGPAAGGDPDSVSAATAEGDARLVFVGDLMFGRYVGSSIPARDPDAPLRDIKPYISGADLAIGNLEGPLVPSGAVAVPRPSPNLLNLTGSTRMAPPLARAGFDLLSLANNHAFDSGPAGLAYTTLALQRAGVAPFGIDTGRGQTAVVREVRGVKVAFLAYTTIVNMPNTRGISIINPGVPAHRERMAHEITTARRTADVVVVMMHWGTEYAAALDTNQRTLAALAAGAGADIVVGAHPHVSQGAELLAGVEGRDTFVAYSLGNALFDQGARDELRQGLSLDVTVDRAGVKSARLVPLKIAAGRSGFFTSVTDNALGQPAIQRALLTTPPALRYKAVWDATTPAGQGYAIAYRRAATGDDHIATEQLGAGVPSRVQLAGGKLAVMQPVTPTSAAAPGWQVVWASDPGWQVTGYTVGDANADGKPDLIYTLWKRRLTWERPEGGGMRVDQQGGEVLPHIYINTWQEGEMRPLWHGSPRPAPALAVAVAPVGIDRKPLLAVLESANPAQEQAPGTLRLWEWTGGFGYELAATLPGAYSEMWSDARVLLYR